MIAWLPSPSSGALEIGPISIHAYGLMIAPGGIAGGIAAAIYVARRRGIAPSALLDAGAPALPLSQAIGRWGNWWNQELFGGATKLPWALEIDDEHLPEGF